MNQAPSSICCLFAVVDRGKGEAVSAELRRRRILTQLVLLGHGTASAEVMDLLGLDEPEKDVVLALLPGDAGEVLAALTDRLELYRPGRGIAFTIGLCSISALAHQRIAAAAAAETPSQKEERPMRSQHELIVVIAEHGFAADVMDAARAAGPGAARWCAAGALPPRKPRNSCTSPSSRKRTWCSSWCPPRGGSR